MRADGGLQGMEGCGDWGWGAIGDRRLWMREDRGYRGWGAIGDRGERGWRAVGHRGCKGRDGGSRGWRPCVTDDEGCKAAAELYVCLARWVAACREGRFSWRFHSQYVLLSLGSPKTPPKCQKPGCIPRVCLLPGFGGNQGQG